MIQELRNKIIEANSAYRLGKSIMSDAKYDQLVDELSLLSPDDELLTKVGITVDDDSRKALLPIEMASMDKLKTLEEISDWSRLKGINRNVLVIITPKLDGLSLCVDEKARVENVYTRGDGIYGQKSNEHYKLIGNHKKTKAFDFTYGEVIMSKDNFLKKYADDYANPRNFVAGLMNSKDVKSPLSDCDYIRYGGVGGDFNTKQEILDELNKAQTVKIDYHICKLSELTEEMLIELFHKWSVNYEIDGVIIEVNDITLQEQLGRETSSNNPVYARAFKHESFAESMITEIVGITWAPSKNNLLKPVAQVKPIKLNGATVANCTLNNAKYVRDNNLGIGSMIRITRSGLVIPKIIDIVNATGFIEPTIIGNEIVWNDNGVELMLVNDNDEILKKRIVSFFEILSADNISTGVIEQLWDAGFRTINQILNLSKTDLEKIDRFGKRKSEIVYNSIKKSISNVRLCDIQYASGCFKNLGSKKLELLEHFTEKPNIYDIIKIDGFAETSAISYIDGYDDFQKFLQENKNITIKKKTENKSNDLKDMCVVFTGVRRDDLSKQLIERGGRESSAISKNVTHLVCKDKNSSSSKMLKAIKLNIKIIDVFELEKILYV